MLDLFSIFGKGGIVLWCFAAEGTKQLLGPSVNALIRDVILQERGNLTAFQHNGVTLKFKLDNQFELVFVAVYQSVVQLSYVDKLLTDVQLEFRDRYKNDLQESDQLWGLCAGQHFSAFDNIFPKLLRNAQHSLQQAPPKSMRKFEESAKSQKTVASMIERPGEKQKEKPPAKKLQPKSQIPVKETKLSPKVEKSDDSGKSTPEMEIENGGETDEMQKKIDDWKRKQMAPKKPKPSPKTKVPTVEKSSKKKPKEARQWEFSGKKTDEAVLDYSSKPVENGHDNGNGEGQVVKQNREFVGTMKGELRGFDEQEADEDEGSDIEEEGDDDEETEKQSSNQKGGWLSSFKSLVGNKKLTAENVQPVMEKMKEHLIGKNVASEIAEKLCSSVSTRLEGRVLGTFTGVTATVKEATRQSLTTLLTPKRRIDILRDVAEANRHDRPYSIVFCGVNGVGKSTNLAKITFWLNENNLRVLIAAGDTFRAGAVEQLRTHTRHLNALHMDSVGLYEQGYGKDPSAIAMHAIKHATENKFDVVLVDTAGRMQDNQPLMRALAKLIVENRPDLVLFVGEALVGNEAIDQLGKFNDSLEDNTPPGVEPPAIDGIVLTKFDTIDDKVGAAISMTYMRGQPIMFVGTGQTYHDLKNLNVGAVVNSLLK